MKVQSINPGTDKLIQEFEASNLDDVNNAVLHARSAFVRWHQLDVNERIGYFEKLSTVIQDSFPDLVSLMNTEAGKRVPDAEGEIYDTIDGIDYYISAIRQFHPEPLVKLNPAGFPESSVEIKYEPYGVVGVIMPWNFPLAAPMMTLISTIISGNTVVFKPSEYTTMMGIEIQKLFRQAGFPDGVIELLIGGEETGKLLVKSEVDKIFFIGSVEAGADIIANAGIKPVQAELGGNSAALVLEDADIELAAKGIAWGGTYHAGQDCVAVKRVYVVEKVANRFIDEVVDIVKGLRLGVDYGPYIRRDALETVYSRIQDAVAHGSELLVGGEKVSGPQGDGYWLTPSVLILRDGNLELVATETFGNTLPIMVVKDADAAIELANASTYGLSNSIWTKNIDTAKAIADKLESGMVYIDDPIVPPVGLDHWNGWKNSGLGSPESKLMQSLKKKVITANVSLQPRGFWYPYPDPE
jgi:acyl-CoA reductase-like NAD-dependent aldehyde dehydrogenase